MKECIAKETDGGVFKDEPVSVLFEDRPDYTEQVLGLRPARKRKVWRVTVEQTVSVTYSVEADTLREARDAVTSDLAAGLDEQVVDWDDVLLDAEVQDTSVYEGDPTDDDKDYESNDTPDFTVKDGRLALPS